MKVCRTLCVMFGVVTALSATIADPLGAQAPQLFACFVPRSGTLYLVGQNGATPACRATDHALVQWNTVGAMGPAGPKGDTGPAGAAATLAGSGAFTQYETVVVPVSMTVSGGVEYFLIATCPVGKVAIGGGMLRDGTNGGRTNGAPFVHEIGSYPNRAFGFSEREWITQISVSLDTRLAATFAARLAVVCVRVL